MRPEGLLQVSFGIAPIFRQSTRQARVELAIENPGQRLKPGMFIRASIVLDRNENVPVIPVQALTKRDDRTGVFLLAPDNQKVIWHEVMVGIQSGDRVEITGELEGRIVPLGQQMLKDGAAVTGPAEQERFAVGSSTALQVAQAQRDLLNSQIAEIEAIVNYRIALVRLYLAEGSLLERRGISVGSG